MSTLLKLVEKKFLFSFEFIFMRVSNFVNWFVTESLGGGEAKRLLTNWFIQNNTFD